MATVELLLRNGATVSSRDQDGVEPIHFAAGHIAEPGSDHECLQTIGVLLAHGTDPDAADRSGRTAMHFAAQFSTARVLAYLLESGGSIAIRMADGGSVLHSVAHSEHGGPTEWLAKIDVLLDRGLHVTSTDVGGRTLIHLAARNAGAEVIRYYLVSRGADPCATDVEGRTALHYVATGPRRTSNECTDVIATLMEMGGDINGASDNGDTPLHSAAASGRGDVVMALIGAGAEPDRPSKNGMTALHVAVVNGHSDVARVLVEKGADRRIRDASGLIAADYVQDEEMEEYLREGSE